MRVLLALVLATLSLPAQAKVVAEILGWTDGKTQFSGYVVYDDAVTEKRPGLKVLAWVWAALICASTVFTKQHSIVDVVCGLAVAFVWVPVLYRPHRKNS